MGAPRPFFVKGANLKDLYDKERSLYREVTSRVERSLPGVEVLALELSGPERMTVFVDHPKGVDHGLCERVTEVLRDYLDRYAVDVSSPGAEPPLRRRPHFERVVGRKVSVRTADEIEGKKRFRGELVAAGERSLQVAAGKDEPVDIPYDAIVRGNLIEEGSR
jgi:ribosome maturation factor RimP